MDAPPTARFRPGPLTSVVLAALVACGGPAAPSPNGTTVEAYAPGVQGELVTQDLGGATITYEIIDGLAVYQGDMVLGDADGVAELAASGDLSPATAACAFDFGFGCGRWTGGVVGYGFADDWGAANATMRARIEAAIAHWEERTSLVFVERTSGQRLVFKSGDGCSSDVGVVALTGVEVQTVRLNATGCLLGQTIHEIGHAIGLWHEQARMDRDAFVRVDFGAVQDGRLHQFFTHLGLGTDVGGYDYASIMHYGCRAFARDARDTIEPLLTGVTCTDVGDGSGRPLGQRAGLSEGDVLGAYWLYPPQFTITGASPGATAPRFDLETLFTTEPVRPEYLVWRSDRVAGVLATGPTLTLRAADVPAGAHVVTASVVIAGTEVVARTLNVNVQNTPPSVDLGPDRQVARNRTTFVTATVVDAEDGDCPPTACAYAWSPFTGGSGGSVGYAFVNEGVVTVRVTVTDSGGATASDEVVLTVVDEPPVPTIASPAPGTTVSLAAGGAIEVPVSGSATDANDGPGPGPGTVPCSDLTWSVSGGGASLSATTGCTPTLTVTTAGTKTLTLTARDALGHEASTERTIVVTACDGNCAPNATFVFDTPQDFAPTSAAPGYYLSTEVTVTATIGDPDVPPNNPIAYTWVLDPPFGAPDVVLGTGSVTDPAGAASATATLVWTPEDDVAAWSNCVTVPIEHFLRLEVEDALGGTTIAQRAFTLACALF